ncbi:dihydrolipoyl dehydrogenase [Propioniferax innocua]|uniref:Dihydrolipoyl dehydrogenase n=1 Tax=Propioniferax innocua TaxID=1753 RepID=A0A542ZR51_9ACTN|nr:dihydrolipoyl dehydrogenase [Propioniferax innocua]TQL62729.1 dihydrolipoamide dehydrogenase [Propioniferax innocua]
MSDVRECDVVVIGAGPGGYPAAIRAAQLGLKTVIVERDAPGGICLNWGCIPTKSLLHTAELIRGGMQSAPHGVRYGEPEVSIADVVAHSRAVSAQLASGVTGLLAGHGAELVNGVARVVDKGEVEVETSPGRTMRLLADHIIVATGAKPRQLDGIDMGDSRVWTYREALIPDRIPDSLVVVGSGAIGSEFASIYQALGSRVTLLEAASAVLPAEEAAVSEVVDAALSSRGIVTAADATIVGVDQSDSESIMVEWETSAGDRQRSGCDAMLLAVGVQANTSGLGLERFDILRGDGSIITDDAGKTGVWGLYAVGDVAGGPCLAHKATAEAIRCVDALAGVRRVPEPGDWKEWIPRCTYTDPEVASIGISAAEARRRGYDVATGKVSMADNGRCLGAGETTGFAEVTIDRDSGRFVGANLVGAGVTELIGMISVAHTAQMTAAEFARSIIPHPTRSEVVHEAVLKALGRPVNSL